MKSQLEIIALPIAAIDAYSDKCRRRRERIRRHISSRRNWRHRCSDCICCNDMDTL